LANWRQYVDWTLTRPVSAPLGRHCRLHGDHHLAPRWVDLDGRRIALTSNPPAGLLSVAVWELDEDRVSALFLWETPEARGDFSAERIMPLVQAGELTGRPEGVQPFSFWSRE